MRFGGLVAIDDLSFAARRGEITAIIGPNGAGKTTVFNCITGFYKPTEGMIALYHPGRESRSCWSGWRTTRSPRPRVVARTFQNIRLFVGMTVLENLLVAQHRPLSRASVFSIAGAARACRATAKPKPKRSNSPATGWRRSASSTAPTMPPATCPMATSAAWKSPAPCARARCCCASTSPPPASTRANPHELNQHAPLDQVTSTASRSC